MELQYTKSSGRSIESTAAAAAAEVLSAVKMSSDQQTCDFASRIMVKLGCHDTDASPAAAASSMLTRTLLMSNVEVLAIDISDIIMHLSAA